MCSDADAITDLTIGGKDSLAMVGHAYMNEGFSQIFRKLMESEINDFGVASMFWEEFYAKHMRQLTFYKKEFSPNAILEFDSIDDLRTFDSEFLLNVDSEIITNICETLKCNPNSIIDISVINAGLTNVSFAFECNGEKYVYRHPGGTAGNLIDRQSELFAQLAAKKIGIDKSVIHMEMAGWKISHYVQNAKNCNFEKSNEQLTVAMKYLHRLHEVEPDESVKIFDDVAEGKKLMDIASAIKGNLRKESAITATPCYQLLGSNDENATSKTWVDRDKYIQIACPYGFRFDYLLNVYKRAKEKGLIEKVEPHTTSLMYALGDRLYQAYGDQTNIKITTKEDLALFEGYVLLQQRKMKL